MKTNKLSKAMVAKNLMAAGLAALLFVLLAVPAAFAHSIDYLVADLQPELIFAGQSGHFRLANPLVPGGIFKFQLTLELIESAGGATTLYPIQPVFTVKNMSGGPGAFSVLFDATGTDTYSPVYYKTQKAFVTGVTVTAPLDSGSFSFKIQATDGLKGKGLQPGEGIVIHFKVEDNKPIQTVLTLALASPSILYRAPANDFIALLTTVDGVPVAGEPIDFSVNGVRISSIPTDADGIATLTYNTSGLPVGDHTVVASYQGGVTYAAPNEGVASKTQCITYKFLGFQPPVLVQDPTTSGIATGLFQGKVIPVKIRIADFYGKSVANAEARTYYSPNTSVVEDIVEQPALAIQADTVNLMRYDSGSDQYIINWNISGLSGSYNIRIGLEEGSCATAHWANVIIRKSGK